MGCWNGTCMVSNLPIISGEKIKLVLLKSNLNEELFTSGGFCYCTGMMTPAFLAISGKYDDYGNIKDIEQDWNYDIITKVLKKYYQKIKIDGNPSEEFTLENIIDEIERDRLQVMKTGDFMHKKDEDFVVGDLSFVMIRQDVWDGICKEYGGDFWNDRREETDKGIYTISAKEWCSRRLNEFVELFKDFRSTEDEREKMRKSFKLSDKAIFHWHGREIEKLEIGRSEYNEHLENIISNLIDKQENDIVLKLHEEPIFKAWFEHIAIGSFLESTRKSWIIQQGKGSQDANWDDYKLLNKIVDTICDKKVVEYEE